MPKRERPNIGLNSLEFERALLMDRVEAARRFLPRAGLFAAAGLTIFGLYEYLTDPRHYLQAWKWRGLGVLILLITVLISRIRLSFIWFSVLMCVPPVVMVWSLALVATEVDTGLLRYTGSISLMLAISGAWFFRKRTFYAFQLVSLMGLYGLSRQYAGTITQQVLLVNCFVGCLCGAMVYDLMYRLSRRALRLQLELHTESRTDPLTALPNRRAFLERADEQLQRAKRRQKPFCVALVDADHFKHINDQLGHDAGDAVLQTLANILANAMGSPSLCGRLGGEEFALLLEMDAEAGLEFANKLVEEFRDYDWALEGLPKVGVSIGIAAAENSDQSVADLLKRADQALYVSKNTGRGRASLAGISTETNKVTSQI
jgi:diguanylate cyclase (GGDEF)-like protein